MSTGGGGQDPFTTGSAEAARLAREVQNFGFDAARTVVDRFAAIFEQFTSTMGDRGAAGEGARAPAPPFHLRADPGAYRRLQSDMQRAADSYLAVLGQLNELALQYLDTSRSDTGAGQDADGLDLPEVAPGGRSSARLWLHNTTSTAAVGLRPWIPSLVNHAGRSLPAGAVTFVPAGVDHLEADSSRAIVVVLDVGDDALPGTYHGQILVERLPDVVFPLSVHVRPATAHR
jgi:hypothetical protein